MPVAHMAPDLELVFRELGLAQYLDSFVEQGFESWDTILDIQESDLDALGVKLGHRRKLQRRIANARGVNPSLSLGSPLKAPSEDGKLDAPRAEPSRDAHGGENGGVTKRKYRRHPKPDENAPERPPSAYVLFSNKMREDLKSQNLTFTEIAKLVGENWQNLAGAEKEAYENQANSAKEKYHRDMVEYKKTPEYRRYAHYLQEFKERQAKQSQAHDAKRPKLEPIRLRHGSSSSSSANASGTSNGNGSNSGSSSERFLESETLPIRRERLSSNASMTESHCSTMLSNTLNRENSLDESRNSPIAGHFGRTNDPINNHQPTSRQASWRDDDRKRRTNRQQGLPSLSDMFDGSKLGIPSPASVELNPYSSGFVAANHPRSDGISITSHGRVPTLRHEPSSNGSSASASSAASYSRSSRDGSLPIHALLTGQSSHGPSRGSFDHPSPASTATSMTSPIEPPKSTLFEQAHGSRGYGFQSGSSAFEHMNVEQSGDGDVVMSHAESTLSSRPVPAHRSQESFDGMQALLRAGEIVGRRN